MFRTERSCWHMRRHSAPTDLPAVRTLDRMNLMLSDDGFHGGKFGDLMADGTGIRAVEFCATVRTGRRLVMFHAVALIGGNQWPSALDTSSLPAAFLRRLRLDFRRRHSGAVGRRWPGRISGVHAQQSLQFLQPFDQHHKTRSSRRTTLVPRLLRDALWFDDRSVAHLRNLINSAFSRKTSL